MEPRYNAPTPIDVFDHFKQAKARFDHACQALANAQQEKAVAEKELTESSQAAGRLLDEALQDPTVPRPAGTAYGNALAR